MKKVLFTLITILGLSTGIVIYAQPVGGSGPIITVDKETHDYGTIEQDANGECTFTITNTGTEALIISLCKGSCGCTVPVCPEAPIAPGASSTISVKYNTTKVGPINRTVTITSNASNEPLKTITISGNVTAKPVEATPITNGTPIR